MTEDQIKVLIASEISRILGDTSNVPLEVQRALETRLAGISLVASSKTAASGTQAVNEGGASSYSVSKNMNGFVETRINGVTIYIPYFT